MACHGLPDLKPEWLGASGRNGEKLSLQTLQSKMKCDPEGYESELVLLYRHFDSSLHLFQQQSALTFSSVGSDPTVAKDLGDMAMFLAHVTPFYPSHLSDFPNKLADLLRSSCRSLPSFLRCHISKALILLINRQFVDIGDTLALFMELQTLDDRNLRILAFHHVIQSIRRMNKKHKNESKNRALQNILFKMLQEEDEAKAKRSLIVLCDLHRRRVWFEDRTADAICKACFHPSSRIMVAALSFLLGYEKNEDPDDSEDSDSEDETNHNPQIILNREAIYKAHHKGTLASKKKKQAKLQRAIRSMKRQQRSSSENTTSNYYSPLNHLKDAQGFAENLFSRLNSCNERFEVKMMMLKVIARTVGLHRLILLRFYPFIQNYIQPHQRDITELLAAAVQACHDMVPPDAVEPLFRQVVNQFVHDRSRTEAIAVGLNVVREICLRMPLLMTEDLLQDLVLYKKSHEKAINTAARSLITLFREVCPSLLVKKDRGRPTNPKARPKAFGEVNISSDVSGIELLQDDDDDDDQSDATNLGSDMSDDNEETLENTEGESVEFSKDENDVLDEDNDSDIEEDDESDSDDDNENDHDEEEELDSDDEDDDEDDDESNTRKRKFEDYDELNAADTSNRAPKRLAGPKMDSDDEEEHQEIEEAKGRKRKLVDYDDQMNAADTSLRALKRLAGSKTETVSSDLTDGILSNEDFKRIKELKESKNAKLALAQHGLLKKGADAKSPRFKIPSSEELSLKRVDPSQLEINIKRRISKEEKLSLVKEGREDREKFQARTAMKQKKTGGKSNKQKEHMKAMPLAAKRAKVARSRQEKKRQRRVSAKQFRGKKAWK